MCVVAVERLSWFVTSGPRFADLCGVPAERGLKTQGSIIHVVFRVGRCRIRKSSKFGRSLYVETSGKQPDWLGTHGHSSYEVSHSLRLGGLNCEGCRGGLSIFLAFLLHHYPTMFPQVYPNFEVRD